MKKLLFLLLFTLSIFASAQNDKSSNKILDSYIKELKLSPSNTERFTAVYNKYYTQLTDQSIDPKTFNKINKLRDLEFSEILGIEKIRIYRNLKKTLEPNFGYRIK